MEEMAQRIATVIAQRPWIVLEDDGAVVGVRVCGAAQRAMGISVGA